MQQFLTFVIHHWFLWLMLAIIILLLILLELQQKVGGVEKLSPLELVNMMNHDFVVIVDIRPNDTFMAGHILGAQNVPASEIERRINKLEKHKNQPVIIV